MCMLPATISNNVAGTDLSIGADTSLNAIVEVRHLTRPIPERPDVTMTIRTELEAQYSFFKGALSTLTARVL